jgi:hypothetical protein
VCVCVCTTVPSNTHTHKQLLQAAAEPEPEVLPATCRSAASSRMQPRSFVHGVMMRASCLLILNCLRLSATCSDHFTTIACHFQDQYKCLHPLLQSEAPLPHSSTIAAITPATLIQVVRAHTLSPMSDFEFPLLIATVDASTQISIPQQAQAFFASSVAKPSSPVILISCFNR